MIAPVTLLALFASALPHVEIDDATSCVARVELLSGLAAALPDEPAINALDLQVGIERDADRNAPDARAVHLVLRNARGELLLERTSRVSAEDCQVLPEFIASVVVRRLEALPRHTWSTPEDTPAFSPRYRSRLIDVSSVPAAPVWRVRLGVGGGVGVGTSIPSLQPQANAAAWIGAEHWPRLVLALRGTAGQHALGQGIVQMLSSRAGAGLSYDFELGSLLLVPELLLAGGCYAAWGSEFGTSSAALLPLVALHGNLTLFTGRVFFLSIGFEVPLTVIQFYVVQSGGAAVYEEPRFRVSGAVGFAWDLL
jgi:hypothetical protein